MSVNKKYRKFAINLLPLLLFFVLAIIAYKGALSGFQTDDYEAAANVVDEIKANSKDLLSTIQQVLTISYGGLTKVHWTPVSTTILYAILGDDSLKSILFINLLLLVACGSGVYFLTIAFGASRVFAILAAAWVVVSQDLVFVTTSAWGVVNLLPPLFSMLAVWVLWKWISAQEFKQGKTFSTWAYIGLFVLCFILAVLSKETEIRQIVFIVGAAIGLLLYSEQRRAATIIEITKITVAVTITVILYFALRYYLTDAEVPLVRSANVVTDSYQSTAINPVTNIKNAAQLLLGSISPVSNYEIYLALKDRRLLYAFGLILPGIIVAASLMISLAVAFIRGSKKQKLLYVLITSAILASLFPEALLGKVSEIYAMVSIWPIAVLAAVVLSDLCDVRCKWRYPILIFFSLVILTNLVSTRIKVLQLVETGSYAHSMRQSMLKLSESLVLPGRIAILHQRRSEKAFGPFGEKGIYAGGSWPRGSVHKWVPIQVGSGQNSLCGFHLVLIESNDRARVELYDAADCN